MELSGIIENARLVCEWNFPVSQKRIVGLASGTFRYHRKGSSGLRVELSGIIEKSRWVYKWNFPVSQKNFAGFASGTFWYHRKKPVCFSTGTFRCHSRVFLGFPQRQSFKLGFLRILPKDLAHFPKHQQRR